MDLKLMPNPKWKVKSCESSEKYEKCDKDIIDTPEHILMEWELLVFIIDYTGMRYTSSEYVSFSMFEIENEYEKLFNYELDEEFDITHFVENYGIDGMYDILSYRKGVYYDDEYWYIKTNVFLKYITEQYKEDEDRYGIFFDKPWLQ